MIKWINNKVKKEKSKVEIESERKGGYEEKKENTYKQKMFQT